MRSNVGYLFTNGESASRPCSRSLELHATHNLLAGMIQLEFIRLPALTYKGLGRDTSRDWRTGFQKMPGTLCDHMLNLRLKYFGEIFRKSMRLREPVWQ